MTMVFLFDLIWILAALYLAWWLRFETPLAVIGEPLSPAATFATYKGHFLTGTIFMALSLISFRAYDRSQFFLQGKEIRVLFRAVLVWGIAFLSLSLALKIEPDISRIYCAVATICILSLLIPWRLLVRRRIIPQIGSILQRRVLMVGWNEGAQQIANAWRLGLAPELRISGVLASKADQIPSWLPVLGEPGSLSQSLDHKCFDCVLVADKGLEKTELSEIASICEKEMVDFELIPSCFPSLVSGLSMKHVHGVPVLGVTQLPLHLVLNVFLKRCLDIAGALVGLTLAVPVIIVFGLLIKRESPGGIFYKQRRLGLNGHEFDMWKLRSMKLNAELGDVAGWTVENDPRCLKIGRRMRSWNIDEIPQFWNVLKGDMSLVGPRPERPQLIERFKEEVPNYNARHLVKPGMTGWAQVSGLRGDTDLTDRVRYDLYYIENWNLVFDLVIMIKTLLSRKGAC